MLNVDVFNLRHIFITYIPLRLYLNIRRETVLKIKLAEYFFLDYNIVAGDLRINSIQFKISTSTCI